MDKQTKFAAYRVEEVFFKIRPVKENEKFTLSPKFTCSIRNGANDFTATLKVELGEGVSLENTPFDLKVSLSGRFMRGDDVGTDRGRQLKLAVNTLFPYLRAFVSNLTANSGLPPFLLPFIDVESMVENFRNEDIVYN